MKCGKNCYMLYLLFSILSIVGFCESGKVFGGTYAKNGEFPFIVAIRGKITCAGSLVTLSKVVTAGHCLARFVSKDGKMDVDNLYVVGGSVKVDNSNAEVRKIISILLNGGYNPTSREKGKVDVHDIGLAILDYPFQPGKYLQVMNSVSWNANEFISKWDKIVTKGTICYAMGWGMTTFASVVRGCEPVATAPSPILKVIRVYPLERESCSMLLTPDDLTRYGIVCVYSVNENETICNGDSGGPLVCNGQPYALLNFGPGCGNSMRPQIYLLYWQYLDFLLFNGTHILASKNSIIFLTFFLLFYNYI